MRPQRVGVGGACLFLLILAGCKISPSPLVIGRDDCAGCHMGITDNRFGGEIITAKGRTYKFDSVICLVRFLRELPGNPQSVLVSDFLSAGTLIDAKQARYLHSEKLTTPMGDSVVASHDGSGLQSLGKRLQERTLDWNGVLGLLR